jgi:hypothetical protein
VAGGRPVQVQVTFTVEEYQAVVARAAAAGLTVPSYLAVTGMRPEGVDAADAKSAVTNLSGTRRVLAGVANNLNQLTAKLHSTGELDESLPAVVEAVERLARRVDAAVEQVAAVVGGRVRA